MLQFKNEYKLYKKYKNNFFTWENIVYAKSPPESSLDAGDSPTWQIQIVNRYESLLSKLYFTFVSPISDLDIASVVNRDGAFPRT